MDMLQTYSANGTMFSSQTIRPATGDRGATMDEASTMYQSRIWQGRGRSIQDMNLLRVINQHLSKTLQNGAISSSLQLMMVSYG